MKVLGILALGLLAQSCGGGKEEKKKVRVVESTTDKACLEGTGHFRAIETETFDLTLATKPTLGEFCFAHQPDMSEGWDWVAWIEEAKEVGEDCTEKDASEACLKTTKKWEVTCIYAEYPTDKDLDLNEAVNNCQVLPEI